jgi:mono/diheme cytochrome c family protein
MQTMAAKISKFIPLAVCSIFLVQCGGPKSNTAKPGAAGDSVSTADTLSSQNATDKVVSAFTYEQRQGKILYTKYCAVCHGDHGKGDGFNAFNLDPKPRDFTDVRAMAGMDEATLLATIREGGKGVSKSPLMPAWGGRMSKTEIEYVIAYVEALRQGL